MLKSIRVWAIVLLAVVATVIQVSASLITYTNAIINIQDLGYTGPNGNHRYRVSCSTEGNSVPAADRINVRSDCTFPDTFKTSSKTCYNTTFCGTTTSWAYVDVPQFGCESVRSDASATYKEGAEISSETDTATVSLCY